MKGIISAVTGIIDVVSLQLGDACAGRLRHLRRGIVARETERQEETYIGHGVGAPGLRGWSHCKLEDVRLCRSGSRMCCDSREERGVAGESEGVGGGCEGEGRRCR